MVVRADTRCRALLGTLVFGSLAIVMPHETPVSEGESMDWTGSVLGISGIIIFNFVWKYVPSSPLPTLLDIAANTSPLIVKLLKLAGAHRTKLRCLLLASF